MENTEEQNNLFKELIDFLMELKKIELQRVTLEVEIATLELAQKKRIANDI
jgi:hypothetical protein